MTLGSVLRHIGRKKLTRLYVRQQEDYLRRIDNTTLTATEEVSFFTLFEKVLREIFRRVITLATWPLHDLLQPLSTYERNNLTGAEMHDAGERLQLIVLSFRALGKRD
jgi:hypothetical protein